MKPFDEQFADKVREVFDKHEEPYNPAAWEALSSAMGGKGKGRLFSLAGNRHWLGAAAMVLLLAGVFLLWDAAFNAGTFEQTGKDRQLADDAGRIEDSRLADPAAASELPVAELPGAEILAAETPASPAPSTIPEKPLIAEAGRITKDAPGEAGLPEDPSPVSLAAAAIADKETETILSTETTKTTEIIPERQGIAFPLYQPDARQPGMPETALFAEPRHSDVGVSPGAPSPLSWDIAAGPMLTYVNQQLASGMGFAGGLTTQWRFSRQLSLSSGMLLAYQQFSVQDMSFQEKHFSGERSGDLASAEIVADHDYELMSLDFPLNIRWQFHDTRRQGMFVSAGFSSLLFVQQNVSGQTTAHVREEYMSPALGSPVERSYSTTAEYSSSYQAFNRFDLARLLNLSVGYALKRDHGTVVIEPFMKLPLGDVGSRELRMGMGGVVMRYQFGQR